MSTDWKPGDVAMMRCRDGQERIAMLTDRKELDPLWIAASEDWGRLHDDVPVRPLVVIDPDDAEQVKRLADLYMDGSTTVSVRSALAAALREFASPTPPKPEEPTGRGAVVEDRDGDLWVKHANGSWSCLMGPVGADVRTWDELCSQYAPIEVRS